MLADGSLTARWCTRRVVPRSGLLFGLIYWRLGRSQSAIQDRLGLMQARSWVS